MSEEVSSTPDGIAFETEGSEVRVTYHGRKYYYNEAKDSWHDSDGKVYQVNHDRTDRTDMKYILIPEEGIYKGSSKGENLCKVFIEDDSKGHFTFRSGEVNSGSTPIELPSPAVGYGVPDETAWYSEHR